MLKRISSTWNNETDKYLNHNVNPIERARVRRDSERRKALQLSSACAIWCDSLCSNIRPANMDVIFTNHHKFFVGCRCVKCERCDMSNVAGAVGI